MLLLPHVKPEMLHAGYWLARVQEPDAPLCDTAEVAAFNAAVYEIIGVPPVFSLPDVLPGDEVRALIPALPDAPRYDVDGRPIGEDVWRAVEQNIARAAIPSGVVVRYGLATGRAAVRLLPTGQVGLKTPGELALDRLQETTIDLGWPLAIVHTSADGHWHFALTPHYWGWVEARRVALGDRAAVQAYAEAVPFVMPIAPWADVARPAGAHHRVAQMATRLPLVDAAGPLCRVHIPQAGGDGRLALVDGFIAADDPDWQTGPCPLTLRTVFTQAFRLLGEPYAWGGMRLGRAGRDCSRLVRDSFAAGGVFLPRNSGQQGRVGRPAVTFAPEDSNPIRLEKLAASVPPGALLILPGHVMLYLGMVDGIPYAIHDLWGYAHPEGHVTPARQVVVSALPPEPSAAKHTLLERLTHAQVLV